MAFLLPEPEGGVLQKRAQRFRRNERWWAAALLASNLLLLALFTYRPLLDNFHLSLFSWNISSPISTFSRLDNCIKFLARPDTTKVVFNTVAFTFSAVAGSMILGLVPAMLLNQKLFGRNFVRSMVFAPFVISGVAIGGAFQFVFDPNFGLAQDLLGRVGIDSPQFYQDPKWALFMVTFTFICKNLGCSFVIYLAALQGLNKDLSEAADIDGAAPGRSSGV